MSFVGPGDGSCREISSREVSPRRLSLHPPEMEGRMSLICHRLHEYRSPAFCSSEWPFSFVLSLCYTGIQLFIGTEKPSVFTLIHQSVHLLVYLFISIFAGKTACKRRFGRRSEFRYGQWVGVQLYYSIFSGQGFWCEVGMLLKWSALARRKCCLGDVPLWIIRRIWVSIRFTQWLMLPLQGEAQMLLGGQLVEEDRGNYGVRDVEGQRGKIIFQCPSRSSLGGFHGENKESFWRCRYA